MNRFRKWDSFTTTAASPQFRVFFMIARLQEVEDFEPTSDADTSGLDKVHHAYSLSYNRLQFCHALHLVCSRTLS